MGIQRYKNPGHCRGMYYFCDMKNPLYPVLAFTLLLSASCDNTIELEAPYQETGVIYGLLNTTDSVQYVRIQKAFLGKGNALVMAQNTDSIYYPDILDVQMYRLKNGDTISSFPLSRIIGPDKVDGIFPSSPNILYRTPVTTNIFSDSEYLLVVKNQQTGYTFSAQTPVVDSIKISRPNTSSDTLVKWVPGPIRIYYETALNGKLYHLTIRFHYKEQDMAVGVLEPKFIDWEVSSETFSVPGVEIRREITGNRFYEFVASKLQPGNYLRYAGKLEFIFTTGEKFLADYINIHSSATTSIITPPHYSNVKGGIGIFSSRAIQIRTGHLDPPSLDRLKSDTLTNNLGFQ